MSANPTTQLPLAEGQAPRRIPSDILQLSRAEAVRVRRRMVEVLE